MPFISKIVPFRELKMMALFSTSKTQNWPSDGNLVIVGLLAWKKQFIAHKHFCENELVFSLKCLSAIIPLIKY